MSEIIQFPDSEENRRRREEAGIGDFADEADEVKKNRYREFLSGLLPGGGGLFSGLELIDDEDDDDNDGEDDLDTYTLPY